jgi:hypothetical protein
MLSANAVQNKRRVSRFAGVIKAASEIRLRAARPENEEIGAPTTPRGFVEQPLSILRANRPLEAMKQQDTGCASRRLQTIHLDEIFIRRVPTLEHSRGGRLSPEKLSPKSLEVPTGDPPRGRIDYFTRH